MKKLMLDSLIRSKSKRAGQLKDTIMRASVTNSMRRAKSTKVLPQSMFDQTN